MISGAAHFTETTQGESLADKRLKGTGDSFSTVS